MVASNSQCDGVLVIRDALKRFTKEVSCCEDSEDREEYFSSTVHCE